MSIQLAAKHLAAHGRGPDTTLVHMTPGEVASLQSLAQQHGGSLTINPHTGLPEAGFLSALLPMAAGAGLAAMGMPAGYAALAVGATSAATNGGDLKKGMLAGISAYGGADIAESFMGAGLGAMSAPTTGAAPTTVLETPTGAASPYALTSSTTAPSTTGYSLGEPSGFGNKALPSLVSTAPAEAARQAATLTPAAQAAKQTAALNELTMGQRWDALKAGATGTNAMNYIKANPLTSLGVGLAAMTPDDNNTPQKAANTDRGARAGMQYYPGWSTPTPKPNMYGVEQTYNRPYYAAEGGVTRMATGGITSAPRNQQQLFADYLQRVSNSGAATTPPTNNYDWWKNSNNPVAPAPAPVETPEEYAARARLNARGGGGGSGYTDPNPEWTAKTDAEKTEYYAQHPFESSMANLAGTWLTKGLGFGLLGMGMDAANGPGYVDRKLNILRGIHPPADSPLAGGPLVYSTEPDTNDPASVGMVFPTEKNWADSKEVGAYPYGNFAAAPLSSRTDVSGYPLRESELRSLENGLPRYSAADEADKMFAAPENNQNYIQGLAMQQAIAANPMTYQNVNRALQNAYYTAPLRATTTPEAQQAAIDSLTSDSFYADKPDYTPESLKQADIAAEARLLGLYPAEAANEQTANFQMNTPMRAYNEAVNAKLAKEAEARENAKLSAQFNKIAETPALREQYNLLNLGFQTDEANNAEPGDRYAPITPFVPGAISADPNADKKVETPNIPDAATFAAMVGAPIGTYASAADGSTVSDAGVLGGVPAFNMGRQSSGLAGITGGFGGLGSAWQGVVGRDGSPVLTSQGAAERAFLSDPNNIALGNEQALQGYTSPLSDPAQRQGQTPDGGGEPSGGWIGHDADPGDHGYGSTAAVGGLSTPYGFQHMAQGGLSAMANSYDLGSYSDGGRLLKGPGDGVSDSIPATIGKGRPARLADGEFVIPARIVSEIGNGSTDAGARKLYAMMDRIQAGRKKSVGKGKVAVNSRADRHLPA